MSAKAFSPNDFNGHICKNLGISRFIFKRGWSETNDFGRNSIFYRKVLQRPLLTITISLHILVFQSIPNIFHFFNNNKHLHFLSGQEFECPLRMLVFFWFSFSFHVLSSPR